MNLIFIRFIGSRCDKSSPFFKEVKSRAVFVCYSFIPSLILSIKNIVLYMLLLQYILTVSHRKTGISTAGTIMRSHGVHTVKGPTFRNSK